MLRPAIASINPTFFVPIGTFLLATGLPHQVHKLSILLQEIMAGQPRTRSTLLATSNGSYRQWWRHNTTPNDETPNDNTHDYDTHDYDSHNPAACSYDKGKEDDEDRQNDGPEGTKLLPTIQIINTSLLAREMTPSSTPS